MVRLYLNFIMKWKFYKIIYRGSICILFTRFNPILSIDTILILLFSRMKSNIIKSNLLVDYFIWNKSAQFHFLSSTFVENLATIGFLFRNSGCFVYLCMCVCVKLLVSFETKTRKIDYVASFGRKGNLWRNRFSIN